MVKIMAGDEMIECLLLIFDKDGTIVDHKSSLLSLAKARFTSISRLAGEQVANIWAKTVGVNLPSGWIDPEGPFGLASPPRTWCWKRAEKQDVILAILLWLATHASI